MSRVEMQQAN